MIKEIPFSGFSAVPSDYLAPDGSLAASTNLIPEDSQLKPIFAPKQLMKLSLASRLVLIHNVPGQTNFIIRRGNTLLWMPKPSEFGADVSDSGAVQIHVFPSIHDLAIIGNTIEVASDTLQYIIWRDNSYSYLGSKPTLPRLEFSLFGVKDARNEGASNQISKTEDPDDFTARTNAVMAAVLKAHNACTEDGRFTQPFFVRYALRLFTGDYISHSAPILMLPSCCPPYVARSSEPTWFGINSCRLRYQLVHPVYDFAQTWKDVIESVDIFVSAPLWTFDQSAQVNNTLYDYPANFDGIFSGSDVFGTTEPYPKKRVYYMGVSYTGAPYGTLKYNDSLERQIRDCSNFYKIASIPIANLSTSIQNVPIEDKALTSITTRQQLSFDFREHHAFSPKRLTAYNSRLHLTGFSYTLPAPFPLRTAVAAAGNYATSPKVSVVVRCRLEGKTYSQSFNGGIEADSSLFPLSSSNPPVYIFYPDPSAYQMELREYVNDEDSTGMVITLPLEKHPTLDGAYYFRPFNSTAAPSTSYEGKTALPYALPIESLNKIYVSEADSPWVFKPESVVSLPFGEIYALASASRALSQGQFGQFPLYAFSSEGVWALEVSATGTYSARQPISRDVCTDPGSIVSMDSSVLFATKRGIMNIAGSQVVCITDSIRSETPFDVSSLPKMQQLHRYAPDHSSDNCIPLLPFSEFLSGCGLIYDYHGQRIVAFNPAADYAYVYSLRSQQWGMMLSQFAYAVPSYPDAYAVCSSTSQHNWLVDLNQTDQSEASALLVTRPLKLDAPDVLKSIDDLIVRGDFSPAPYQAGINDWRGRVQCVLYGSRDLVNWHLVFSSKNHRLRGLRGSPYKYFRLACIAYLRQGESISGFSVSFAPRYANRLR